MTTHEHLAQPEYPLSTPDPGKPWESMYRAERKTSRILGASTVAASLVAVGLAAWGLNGQGDTAANVPGQPGGPGTSQFGPPGSTATRPGTGAPLGQDLAAMLFTSDGSVNADALAAFLASMPTGALDQILAMAVSNGEITADQAKQITDAAAGTATSDSTSAQDT